MGLKTFDEEEIDEGMKMKLLAQRIEHLLRFAGALIPEIETLERLYENADERERFANSAAPLLGAFNIDYEEKAAQANLHKRRAEALVNLIKVLRDTELERTDSREKAKIIDEQRKFLNDWLG